VAEAAEAAEISRATAYRYFPTQGLLLAEVALFAVGGPLVDSTIDRELPPEEATPRPVSPVLAIAPAGSQTRLRNQPLALRLARACARDGGDAFRS
jgi:AcrR family transcriptional regulator